MGITIIENGPLKVDSKNVKWMKGDDDIDIRQPAMLCVCGSSKNKPYCDGAHMKNGFSSKKDISKEIIQTYEGKDITIHFNRSICAGASTCVSDLNKVFKSGDGDNWIYPDNDINNNIIKTISKCPSGALSYQINDKVFIDKREVPKISIVKDGPYNVEAIDIETSQIPTNYSETKYALCRCGNSKNKPYCDYSHAQSKWSDE